MTLDARIDALYSGPLADFVSARGDLAKALRGEGDREGAARVKSLGKPSATAWAINRLTHEHPGTLESLVERTREVGRALAAGGPVVGQALEARRQALAAAVAVAEGLLAGHGQAVTPARIRAMSGTLEALSLDSDHTARGRLVADLDPPGFGALAGLSIAAAPSAPARPKEPRAKKPRAKVKATRPSKPVVIPADQAAARKAREALQKARSALEREQGVASETQRAQEGAQVALAELTEREAEADRNVAEGKRRADEARAAFDAARAAAATMKRQKRAAEQGLLAADRAHREAREALAGAVSRLDAAERALQDG